MNYTELNENRRYSVLEMILTDCDELRWDEIGVHTLAEKYSAKDIQELIREHNPINITSIFYIPEDLVMDWDEFMIDYWKEYPEGYFVWMMKETAEEMEIYDNRK